MPVNYDSLFSKLPQSGEMLYEDFRTACLADPDARRALESIHELRRKGEVVLRNEKGPGKTLTPYIRRG